MPVSPKQTNHIVPHTLIFCLSIQGIRSQSEKLQNGRKDAFFETHAFAHIPKVRAVHGPLDWISFFERRAWEWLSLATKIIEL